MPTPIHLPDVALDSTKPFSITPLAVVLKSLSETIRAKLPTLAFVFDSTLSYQESARGQRALRSAMQINADTQFPLFGFSRSVLQPMAQTIYRATAKSGIRVPVPGPVSDQIKDIYAVSGQFDLLFRIYARDVAQLEALELLYTTKAAISDVTEFTVHIPWLADAPDITENPNWEYRIQWHPLDDFVAQHDPFLTFSVSGRATVSGTFLSGFLRDGRFIDFIHLTGFVDPDTTTPIVDTVLDVRNASTG